MRIYFLFFEVVSLELNYIQQTNSKVIYFVMEDTIFILVNGQLDFLLRVTTMDDYGQ